MPLTLDQLAERKPKTLDELAGPKTLDELASVKTDVVHPTIDPNILAVAKRVVAGERAPTTDIFSAELKPTIPRTQFPTPAEKLTGIPRDYIPPGIGPFMQSFYAGALKGTRIPQMFGLKVPKAETTTGKIGQITGQIAEGIAELYAVAGPLTKLGVFGKIPKGAAFWQKMPRLGALFATTQATDEIRKGIAEQIHPEIDAGYKGAPTVLRAFVEGAIVSMAFSGVSGIWNKLKPTEQSRALKLLGLKKGATVDQIRRKAAQVAKKYHPDKAKGMREQFEKVIRARDALLKTRPDIVKRGVQPIRRGFALPGEVKPTVAPEAPRLAPEPRKPIEAVKPTAVAPKAEGELTEREKAKLQLGLKILRTERERVIPLIRAAREVSPEDLPTLMVDLQKIESKITEIEEALAQPPAVAPKAVTRLYHQTSKKLAEKIRKEGFKLDFPIARRGEDILPDAVFLKPTEKDISVGGVGEEAAQIPVDVDLVGLNVKEFSHPNKLQNFLEQDETYKELKYEAWLDDRERAKQINALSDEFFKVEPDKPRRKHTEVEKKKFHEKIDELIEKGYEAPTKARRRATEYLKEQGIDAIIIKEDPGFMGRKTETIAILDPTKVHVAKPEAQPPAVAKPEAKIDTAKIAKEARLNEIMTKAEMGEVPTEGEYRSQSAAFNEHIDYFEGRQLPTTSKIPQIQKQMRVVNGKRLAGTITAQAANKQIRQFRKQLYATARKEGIALRMTKGGKLSLAVRKAGTYVPEEFAQYGKFKNISPMLGGGQDITRATQQIDGSLSVKEKVRTSGQAGPIERHVLWPTRDMSMQKLKYLKEKQAELKALLKTKRGSNEDAKINEVLERIAKEDRNISIKDVLDRETLKAIASPKIIKQAVQLRRFYDDLIEEQNLARELRGQESIPYRQNYSPHILRDTTIWERLMMKGRKATVADVFGKKADLPDYIKPNKPFNPREMAREAGIPYEERVLSATDLAESYLVTAAKDIFNTSIIQNNKAFIQQLEAMGHDKSANYLADWTAEAYAGVKPRLERAIALPQKVERGARYFNRLRNMAVFPLNMSWSMLTQTSSLALTVGRYGTKNTLHGFIQWLNPQIRKQAATDYYSYIVKSTRQGKLTRQDAQNLIGQKVELRKTPTELAQDISTLLLEQLEKLLTGTSIRAAYLHGKKRGLTGEALKNYASDGGAKTQSMYNDEDKPGILRPLHVKTAAPYQTFSFEVVNTLREWAGRTGTPPDTKLYTVWSVTRFLAAASLFAALAKKYANKDVWSWKRPPIPFAEYWLTPIVRIFNKEYIGGSGSGLTSPVETGQRVAKGIDDVFKTGSWRKLRNELIKYGPGILGVPGGVQISRTVDAIIAYAQGGVKDRRGRLMFEMEDPQDLAQAIFSGVWSTEGGRAYLDPEYRWERMSRSDLAKEIRKNTYRKLTRREDGTFGKPGQAHKGREKAVARMREILKAKEEANK